MTFDRRFGSAVLIAIIIAAAVAVVLFPHQVTVGSEGDGKVSFEGNASIRFYEGIELTLEPSDGLDAYVYVDGRLEASRVTSYGFSVSPFDFSGHAIHVVFSDRSPEERVLTVTSNDGGRTDPEGATVVAHGSTQRVTAIADDGYLVEGILVDGESVGSTNTVDVPMDRDHEVRVEFRQVTADDIPVTVSVNLEVETVAYRGTGNAYGHVEPTGTVHVPRGGSLTVSAYLNEGYSVKDVRVDGSSRGPVDEVVIENIREPVAVDVTISAAVQTFILDVSAGSGGSIAPEGRLTVPAGSDQEFVLRASSGHRVSHILLDGEIVKVVGGRFSLEDIRADHTIRAVFQKTGGGGTVVPSLVGIEVTVMPNKTAYLVGEEFDPAGMVVVAKYSDGSEAALSQSLYSWAPAGPLSMGTAEVTVTYRGMTDTVPVSVGSPAVLTGISVAEQPTRTHYAIGEGFDPAGMRVIASYSDGITRDVTASCTFEPGTFDVAGAQDVTVTYIDGTAASCTVQVLVGDPGSFTATVAKYYGTRVIDGSVEAFNEDPDEGLSAFRFDTSGIVPGISQTAEIVVSNGNPYALDAMVHISGITDGGLAEHIVLRSECGSAVSEAGLKEIGEGMFLDLGTIGPGETVRVLISMSFPHADDNNDAMGKTVEFSLGIFADIAGAGHSLQ